MTDIGYHASHEQFQPDALLDYVQLAGEHGFDGVLASDHFQPWSERQGSAGFVWSWLGSAMESTSLSFGTVNAPGYRYHPAIIAQAVGTLATMYPDRFWLSVGSGEALNEHITGEKWPLKADRNARLKESVDVIRRLWDGETVTHDGHVTVEEATLYTRPDTNPPVIGAAISKETAKWLADWADGMITVGSPDVDRLRGVVEAFRENAPEKPVYVKAQLAYDEDEQAAMDGAYDQWRTNSVSGPITENIRTTEQFDTVGEQVTREQVRQNVHVSADVNDHLEWIREMQSLGIEKLFLHDVTRDQRQFIEQFGDSVLPELE